LLKTSRIFYGTCVIRRFVFEIYEYTIIQRRKAPMIKPAALRNYGFNRRRGQFYGNKCVFREKCCGCKAVLRGILLEALLILMRYRVNFFTGVVPQLQFWHIHWLVFIESVGKLR
jgi:hypothetical protein